MASATSAVDGPRPGTRVSTDQSTQDLIRVMRVAGLVMLFALLPALVLYPSSATEFLWFGVFGAIPLMLMLAGYAAWRRVCPLALTSRFASWIRLGGRVRISPRWQERTVVIQVVLFAALVAMRFAIFEDSPRGTLLMLGSLMGLALLSGFVFTGKTWCNHFCPMSFVERTYSGPKMFGRPRDSKCIACTACKKNCPDVDLEASYWKETLHGNRRLAAYALPGIVGAYVLLETAYDTVARPMVHIVSPWLPSTWMANLAAAAAVMVLASGAMLVGTLIAERLLDRFRPEDLPEETESKYNWSSHYMVLGAAFVSFNLYYSLVANHWFAERAVILRLTWVVAATVSGMYLWRVLRRTEVDYLRERFAWRMLAQSKVARPRTWDLQDVYFREILSKQNSEQVQKLYTEALRECIADGVLEPDEDRVLTLLRRELNIPEEVHRAALKVLSTQADEYGVPTHSQEKRYQVDSYFTALKMALANHSIDEHEEKQLRHFRDRYGISPAEHTALLLRAKDSMRGAVTPAPAAPVVAEHVAPPAPPSQPTP